MDDLEDVFGEIDYQDIIEINVKKGSNIDWPYEGSIHYKVKD